MTDEGPDHGPLRSDGGWRAGTAWTVDLAERAEGAARVSLTVGFASGLSPDSQATIRIGPAYAAGTRILTELGECDVERLRPGHVLLVQGGGSLAVRRVLREVVDQTAHAGSTGTEAGALQPIRIRAGAFADGRPCRDLLVSPCQRVLVGGTLIPARCLLNQATVVREADLPQVAYFRIELEQPAMLLSDGLATLCEFNGTAPGRPEQPDAREMERLWQVVAARATLRGYVRDDDPALTRDAGLALRVDGRILAPTAVQDGRYVFTLPGAAEAVHLLSRVARPSDTRPWSDDRRWLGVRIDRLEWRQTAHPAVGVTPIALDNPALHDGWHPIEGGARLRRWTAGAACLPGPHGPALLEVQVSDSLIYAREMAPGAHVPPRVRHWHTERARRSA